jgi:tetratricopeptide (TPR) repeat protein
VFHLHGQHTGFVLLHTTKDVEGHVDTFAPVFEDAGRERTWMVVGYSGECDPVFKHLEKVKEFSRGLYWIGHDQKEPSEHVREGLLVSGKGAFYTKGYDADSFFIKLTQELEIFPPKFVTHPFTHLQDTFEDLEPLILPDQSNINKAIEKYEAGDEEKLVAEALRLSMAGDDEELVQFCIKHQLTTHPQLIEPLAWAYIDLAKALYDQARTKSEKEADLLFTQTEEKLQEALKIKPNLHEALYNLGLALHEHAKTKTGEEADELFVKAREKYQEALKIKPDMYEALFNMACLAALTGDEKGCQDWLEKSIKMEPLTEENINDSDFDNVRELGWFKKLVAESKKKE